jgi:hypothetical protein
MPGGNAVKGRIELLIEEAQQLSGDVHREKAWLTAAQHAVELVCPSASNPYHLRAGKIASEADSLLTSYCVSQMVAI